MRRMILLSSLTILLSAPVAFAHHPFAPEFDAKKPVTLSGPVTKIQWTNPHTMITMDSRDANGQTTQWAVELGGASELTRAGWTKDSVKIGDNVTIEGWQAANGSKRANAKSVKMPSGTTLQAASSFGQSQPKGVVGTSGQLPRTASPLPIFALLSLLSLAGAATLHVVRR